MIQIEAHLASILAVLIFTRIVEFVLQSSAAAVDGDNSAHDVKVEARCSLGKNMALSQFLLVYIFESSRLIVQSFEWNKAIVLCLDGIETSMSVTKQCRVQGSKFTVWSDRICRRQE